MDYIRVIPWGYHLWTNTLIGFGPILLVHIGVSLWTITCSFTLGSSFGPQLCSFTLGLPLWILLWTNTLTSHWSPSQCQYLDQNHIRVTLGSVFGPFLCSFILGLPLGSVYGPILYNFSANDIKVSALQDTMCSFDYTPLFTNYYN